MAVRGTELPNQPDEPADQPPAPEFPPPPLPLQAEAVDWAPPPWANRPAAEPSDLGSITGWAPPPWTADPDAPAGWSPSPRSPDAADTRPFWRRIPARWLIVGALGLVGAIVGWYFIGVNNTTGPPKATVTVTQNADASRSATGEIDKSGNLNVVDLRVGDCFDLKDPTADQIGDINAVPCTTEHEFEIFHVGAIGKGGSYPTDAAGEHRNHGRQVIDIDGAFGRYLDQNCIPAFRAYIGKAWYDDSDLDIYWFVPTDDARQLGDRTVLCAALYPGIYRLTGSLRGTRQ